MDKKELKEFRRLTDIYIEKVGGEPLGIDIIRGWPAGVEEHGGPIAVYKECIEKGVKWETLLNYEYPPDNVII